MRSFIDLEDFEHPKIEELEQTLDYAADWFKEVTEIMYGKKPFDVVDLENALGELGAYLHCKLPNNNLQVTLNQ